MKLQGNVSAIEDTGDYVKITLCKVFGANDGQYSPYRDSITLKVTQSEAKAYTISRRICLEVTPK